MFAAVTVLALTMLSIVSALAQDLAVSLPPGETPLGDIGIYRVAYQSYGHETVEMPPSWTGHFETVSGVSYLPGERVLDRNALLLHSPWRAPAGAARVDYRLEFPDLKPISLSFGIAMRPDMIGPGKSDGVTFSAYLVDGGERKELMRQHWDKGEWQDFHFDLSAYAGKEATLRLQTEPGPANSPSFDYSYFGDAKVAVGSSQGGRDALLQRLIAAKAYRATQGVSLKNLCNNPDTVVPGNLLPCKNSVTKEGDSYQFLYQGADAKVVYTYSPQTGTLDDFSVKVDGSQPFQPALGGGVMVAGEGGGKRAGGSVGSVRSVGLVEGGSRLRVRWQYEVAGQPVEVTWTFGIIGKALTVAASCDQPAVSAFSLGNVGSAPLRRTLYIPYLPADWGRGAVSYLPMENVFVCRYLDWNQSHSSRCPQGEAAYEPKTDGTRNPLVEFGYVAVSPDVGEVLPNAPHQPSRFLDLLGPRVMLDVWSHHKGTYRGDAENLRELKDNGVDHVAIIQHVWQRYGYDVKLPDHIPANPEFGGDEGMIEFGKAANECGYVWSVHENYIDLYPDAPSYEATARVLLADGSPAKAWFNAGTGVQSFGLKCNRALGYAKQNAPTIHKTYGTNAAYLDVHTCVPPWHQLDHEASQPLAAMALGKVQCDSELFRYMQDTHEGPLFGEGHNHLYWAGKVDGVEAQVAGGEYHDPFLDFDLLKLHPQMVNHGMGYYERWFARGYDHRWGQDTGTVEQVDKYRAQELAYGHAGFIGSAQTDNVQWVAREHHLMHPVQRLYGAAKPTEIAYEIDGKCVAGSVALIMGERLRQRVKYDSGLTVWVNWAEEPWQVEGRVLPQWGVLAVAAPAKGAERSVASAATATLVSTSLIDGRLADYAECPAYLFADARTSFNMPYLSAGKDIEPKLADFQYLGDGKIQVTYLWTINDTLPQDYGCFVHGVNLADERNHGIVFQQDHALPKPTSQWQKGETLTDGPYEITVPADHDTYDLVIGLHKGARVPLKGPDVGESRILLGRLLVTREGNRITDITLGDAAEVAKKLTAKRADFTVNLNPPGTMVDFGKLATDGSVKVNKGKNSLTVFPYPREKAFKVALDVKAISGDQRVDPKKVRVVALAAGTQADLGAVACSADKGRVVFEVGAKGAGRYVVQW
jgi:hypothetical protein